MPATQMDITTTLQSAKQTWANVKNNPEDTQAIEQFDSVWTTLQGQIQQLTKETTATGN
jgi:hypothetical protein